MASKLLGSKRPKYDIKGLGLSPYLRLYKKSVGGRGRTRELVRIRDKYTCQDCGAVRTMEEVHKHNKKIKGLKGRIKSFDVHHLKGLCGKKSKGYDSTRKLKNLITLCHKCHYNRPEHKTKKHFDK